MKRLSKILFLISVALIVVGVLISFIDNMKLTQPEHFKGLNKDTTREDILSIYVDERGKPYKTAGKIDYVAGWYFKASKLMQNTNIKTALVSTNSITQGIHASNFWPLVFAQDQEIIFGHTSFAWKNNGTPHFLPMSEDLDPRLDLNELYKLMLRCDKAAEKKEDNK